MECQREDAERIWSVGTMECGLQSRDPRIEVYTRQPCSFYHSASEYSVADSLRLLSWLAPAYVISLNVSSETSLTAENERTKNFKKLEAQMEPNRALLEGFTGQQSRAPAVDTDDKAAFEALDNKVDKALSYGVVIDTRMEQQTDLTSNDRAGNRFSETIIHSKQSARPTNNDFGQRCFLRSGNIALVHCSESLRNSAHGSLRCTISQSHFSATGDVVSALASAPQRSVSKSYRGRPIGI